MELSQVDMLAILSDAINLADRCEEYELGDNLFLVIKILKIMWNIED